MSYFVKADEDKGERVPLRQCRVIPRLRLIALYCDVTADRDGQLLLPGLDPAPRRFGR